MKIKNNIIFFLIFSFLISNPVTDEINKILYSETDYKINKIESLKDKFKNDDNLIILDALLEFDGDKSVTLFSDYLKINPNGKYAELSIFKIAEYNYSKAKYIESAKWYKKIPDNFSSSNKLETAISYYLNSLVIANKSDSARYYANKYKKKFPKINSLNKNFLSDVNAYKNDKIKYTIKLAEYNKLRSALYYKNMLQKEGFPVRMNEVKKNNNFGYELFVGEYKTEKSAINMKKRLFSRLGISNCKIIKLN